MADRSAVRALLCAKETVSIVKFFEELRLKNHERRENGEIIKIAISERNKCASMAFSAASNAAICHFYAVSDCTQWGIDIILFFIIKCYRLCLCTILLVKSSTKFP